MITCTPKERPILFSAPMVRAGLMVQCTIVNENYLHLRFISDKMQNIHLTLWVNKPQQPAHLSVRSRMVAFKFDHWFHSFKPITHYSSFCVVGFFSTIKRFSLLTNPRYRDYSFGQVLNTPPQADCPAPDSRGFFTPMVCLWPGSEQQYNTFRGNIAGRLAAVFKYLAAPLNRERILNITARRPTMASKSTSTSAHRTRKTKSPAIYPLSRYEIEHRTSARDERTQ